LSESTNPIDDSSVSSTQPDAPSQPPKEILQEDKFSSAKRAADKASIEFGREILAEFSKDRYKAQGFKNFDDYAAFRGIEPWRARRLRRVVKGFADLGISVDVIESIGYDTATKLLDVLERGNKEEWLKKAREMSYPDLVKEVRRVRPKKTRTVIQSTPGDQPQSYDPEDAAKLAAKMAPERVRPSSDGKTEASDDDIVYEKRLYLVGTQNTVFETALENMERRTQSDKVGYLLTCCLLEFLAIEGTKDQKSDDRMRHYMWALQERYGGRLMWVKDAKVAKELSELIKKAEENVHGESSPG
jgi:hypothetical protein